MANMDYKMCDEPNKGILDEQEIDYPFEEIGCSGDENRIRGNWSLKMDFFFSSFGFIFGMGNLWRFPHQIAVNGGLVYLIPYSVLFFFIALPILFMELALGQFISLGAVSIWKVAPLFKGIGISMVFISCCLAIYYNIITGWSLYYLINSLKVSIPWATCGNAWNSENCTAWNRDAAEMCRLLKGQILFNGTCKIKPTIEIVNLSKNSSFMINTTVSFVSPSLPPLPNRIIPSLEYFHNHVLMLSSGISDIRFVNWQLAICLLVTWLFVFVCSFKGIKTSGKVVYFTVTMPYIVIFVLLVRLITLPGSIDGVYYFFRINWNILSDLRVWGDAALQVFYSLSMCVGGLTTLASYNRFHNNLFFDIWIIGFVDFFTSIAVSTLVFSAIGFICYEMDSPLNQFKLDEGIKLVFIYFAEALSKLPVAQLFAFLFFGMVSLIIFNSELFIVETVVSAICDEFPERLRRNHRHVLIFLLLIFYTCGILFCTSAGIYWVIFFEKFATTWPLIVIAFFELMVICWIYGIDNFMDNLKWMIRFYPPIYIVWRMVWKFLHPICLMLILGLVWIENKSISYHNVFYPQWSLIFGWIISLSPFYIILGTAIYKFVTTPGPLAKKWRDLLCPEDDWGPALAVHRAEVYPMQIPEARKLMQSYYNQANALKNDNANLKKSNSNIEFKGYKNRTFKNNYFDKINRSESKLSKKNDQYSLATANSEQETII